MNTTAPIRQLTLYKHGVAHIVREASFEGTELAIAVKPSDLDDALKSCTVGSYHPATTVSGIGYQTPNDQGADSASAMNIGLQTAMLDLLKELVGWRVAVHLHGKAVPVAGRVLGVQVNGRAEHQNLLLSDTDTGAVHCLLLSDIAQLVPDSPVVRARLVRELNARQQPKGVQAFTVRVNPGQHRLVVAYLVPSASWRISYRAAASADAEGRPVVRLQAWGLLDNQFGEDLSGVKVAMVAGQPISFRYQLAQPVMPERVTVTDKSRQAAGPIGFDASVNRAAATTVHQIESHYSMGGPGSVKFCQVESASFDAAETQDLGELFEYGVKEPVTMPMGTSALVPLFNADLPGQRELLFNDRKYAKHPVRALLCKNASGHVLEHGPLTVTDDGGYRGEAVLPFTAMGADLYLPYAVELGIHIDLRQQANTEVVSLTAGQGTFWREEARSTRLTWTLSNRTDREEWVTLECGTLRLPGQLQPTATPVAQTTDAYRWTVLCPPQCSLEFAVTAREVNRYQVHGVPPASLLTSVLAGGLCTTTLAERIQPLLPLLQALAKLKAQASKLQGEVEKLEEDLSDARENVSMLSGSDAAELAERRTAVKRALELSDQMAALKARRAELSQAIADAEAQMEGVLNRAVEDGA